MSKWICLGWLALAAGTLLAACGSDEAGGGSGGSGGAGGATSGSGGSSVGTACVKACQRMSSAACGDYATVDCSSPAACPVEEACPSELDAFYGCVANTASVTCTAGRTRAAGCETQATSFVECASCKVVSDDTTCSSCLKTSCCDELTDWNLASDGSGFDTCIGPCQVQSCIDDCIARFPISGAAYNATLACQEASCVRPCVCGFADTDDACFRCVKANCCDSLVTYNQASDVSGFSACLTLCPATDQACADACVTRFPNAGAAFVNLSMTCLDTTCATACSG